jgi:hypothetical protein
MSGGGKGETLDPRECGAGFSFNWDGHKRREWRVQDVELIKSFDG